MPSHCKAGGAQRTVGYRLMESKTKDAVEGCMIFIQSLINDHHADKIDVYRQVAALCQAQVDYLLSIDPNRNR